MERTEDARERRRSEQRALRGSLEREELIRRLADKKAEDARVSHSGNSSNGRRTPENSADMFGHPWPEWFAMRDAAFDFLCECARRRKPAAYGEIWEAIGRALGKDLGSHWRQLPNLLGYVSERSNTEFGTLSTALVIYDPEAADSGPGPGFFRLAASMGLLEIDASPPDGEDWTMSPRQHEFWQGQVQAMYERFAR